MTTFNLRTLKLRSGEQFRDEQEIKLESLELGGQRYLPVPETVPAELTITRASTGTVFEHAFHVRLHERSQETVVAGVAVGLESTNDDQPY